MLQPKRVKYRRPQDGRGNKGDAHRGTQLAFGSFGIKTLDAKWIDSRQIEAARVAINRYMNREGQVWIRIFPDKPITRKPADVRMGKGKGDPAGWVAPVTPGRILFEVEGVPFETAKEALRLGAQKLPVKTKFVVRRDYDKNASAMKMNEIKGLETKELAEKLETAVANYDQLKLNHAVTPLENPSQIKAARRDIARMKTELRQRELNK